jgi:integrase
LTSRERDLVNAALATGKDEGEWATYQQFRWIWSALVLTALRRSELANAHEGNIYIEEDENQLEGWMLEVLGKGGVVKSIPLTAEFMVEFAAYREYHGLPPTPLTHNKGPDDLIPLVVPRKGAIRKVNDALIYRAIKAILARAEQLAIASGNHASANRLRHFSTHSTRHTGVTMIVDATGDITLGMEMARHTSISTTQRYKQKSPGRLRQAMQRSVTAGSSQD